MTLKTGWRLFWPKAQRLLKEIRWARLVKWPLYFKIFVDISRDVLAFYGLRLYSSYSESDRETSFSKNSLNSCLTFHHRNSNLIFTFRRNHQMCFVKKEVLKNFAKFTRKQLCQSLFFNKAAGLRPYYNIFFTEHLQTVHKIWSFQLRISSVNVTKSARLLPYIVNDLLNFIYTLGSSFLIYPFWLILSVSYNFWKFVYFLQSWCIFKYNLFL